MTNAKINQDLSGGNDEKYAVNQEVNVSAANKTQLETHAGTLAGGTVGVGLSSVTTLVENTTKAEIVNGSNVKSKGDIGVNTDAKTYFNSVVVGGAGGKVGVAGNVNVAEIGNHNRALVDASTIAGYGSMTVAAKDVTRLGKRLKDDGTEEDFAVALGAGGVGLYNGTGASVLVSDIANDTTAKIGNSSVDVAKKLSLTADSDSSILSYVFAAGLGAYSGVAGSVAVNTIDNTTEAFITEDEGKTTEINQNMSNASQDVKIAASADAAIENLLGSAAVGLGSAAPVWTFPPLTAELRPEQSAVWRFPPAETLTLRPTVSATSAWKVLPVRAAPALCRAQFPSFASAATILPTCRSRRPAFWKRSMPKLPAITSIRTV